MTIRGEHANLRRVSARLPAAAVVAIALVGAFLAAPGGAPASSQRARAWPNYHRCPNFRYKGKHKLFQHGLGCAKARRKGEYILRYRKAPRGWRCYLEQLRIGFATCGRGHKAFALVPYRL